MPITGWSCLKEGVPMFFVIIFLNQTANHRNQRFILDEMNTKTQIVFFSFFISCNFIFSLMNDLVYVNIDQGIHKGKSKVARNEK